MVSSVTSGALLAVDIPTSDAVSVARAVTNALPAKIKLRFVFEEREGRIFAGKKTESVKHRGDLQSRGVSK